MSCRLMSIALGVGLGTVVGVVSIPVRADNSSARRLFEEGSQAVREGRFAEARDLLDQSLRLDRRAPTAFNLGISLRGVGASLEAVGVFEELLGEMYGALPVELEKQVRGLLRETRREVSRLILVGTGSNHVRATVRVDGAEAGQIVPGRRIERRVNGGSHVVSVRGPGIVTQEQAIEIPLGEKRVVYVELRRTERPAVLTVRGPHPEAWIEVVGVSRRQASLRERLPAGAYSVRVTQNDLTAEEAVVLRPGEHRDLSVDFSSESIWDSPWFWVAVGVVAVGGTAIAVGALSDGSSDEEPVRDPVFGVFQALRSF